MPRRQARASRKPLGAAIAVSRQHKLRLTQANVTPDAKGETSLADVAASSERNLLRPGSREGRATATSTSTSTTKAKAKRRGSGSSAAPPARAYKGAPLRWGHEVGGVPPFAEEPNGPVVFKPKRRWGIEVAQERLREGVEEYALEAAELARQTHDLERSARLCVALRAALPRPLRAASPARRAPLTCSTAH